MAFIPSNSVRCFLNPAIAIATFQFGPVSTALFVSQDHPPSIYPNHQSTWHSTHEQYTVGLFRREARAPLVVPHHTLGREFARPDLGDGLLNLVLGVHHDRSICRGPTKGAARCCQEEQMRVREELVIFWVIVDPALRGYGRGSRGFREGRGWT